MTMPDYEFILGVKNGAIKLTFGNMEQYSIVKRVTGDDVDPFFIEGEKVKEVIEEKEKLIGELEDELQELERQREHILGEIHDTESELRKERKYIEELNSSIKCV